MEIHALTGQHAYPHVIGHILERGKYRKPRGRETLDAGFVSIILAKPYNALPLGTGRKLNTAIAAAEALQLIGGFSSPSLLTQISERFDDFIDGDGFHGAYGSRIRYQAAAVCDKIRHDEETRQAVITLWDPHLDNLPGFKDYPCTVALQFQVENGCLCMNVIMRSNDAWLGLPYDLFQFSQLQMSLARTLDLADGWYRHTALSLHLYEDNLGEARKILAATETKFQPMGVGRNKEDFTTVMKAARRLASGAKVDDETLSEGWFRRVLTPYVG